MIQGAVDQKPVWDISGAPETLSKGFCLGISVWRVTLCLLGHHNPGTLLSTRTNSGSGNAAHWQSWERNRNLLEQGWKLGGHWGFPSSLSLAPKPGKNSVSSPLHTNTNLSQIFGSPWYSPKSHYSPARSDALGAHSSTLQFSLWPSWIPFPTFLKLPPFASWASKENKSRFITLFLLKLFPSRLVTNQAHHALVGHITVQHFTYLRLSPPARLSPAFLMNKKQDLLLEKANSSSFK